MPVDPAGEDQEQQLPRLQNRLHISPDIVRKVEGSGIRGGLSTAGKSDWAVHRNIVDIGSCGSAEFFDHTGRIHNRNGSLFRLSFPASHVE